MQHTPKAGPPSTCLQRALQSTFRVENKLIANNMVFSGLASFRSTIFNDDAMFGTTIFLHDANFAQTQWNGSCFFPAVQFAGNANFKAAIFNGFVRFQSASFGINTKSSMGTLPSDLAKQDFSDCQFDKPTSFRDAKFSTTYPILNGAVLHKNTDFSTDKKLWPNCQQADPKAARESCAKIRHTIAQQGLPEDEHFFFRREMGFAAQIGGFWQRLPYRLFGVFSEYGQSIARPSLWLLGLWLVPALILLSYFAWVGSFGDSVWRGIDAVGLSFANIFTVFGFHRLYFEPEQIRELPALLQVIGAAQTVLALPLLFFLGLALRKRFRLR